MSDFLQGFIEDEEINKVYFLVDAIFKIKIKAQLKGTGLIFEKFQDVTDLLTNKKFYNIVINKKVIDFIDQRELREGLILIINSEESQILKEIEYLQNLKTNYGREILQVDEQIELLYYRENKLDKLRNKLRKDSLVAESN